MKQTDENIKSAQKLLYIFAAAEPAIMTAGIVLLVLFKGMWYWAAFFGLIICYAAFGVKLSDIADGYAKQKYPQFYGTKGRPSNSKIKSAARQNGDEKTLYLKSVQRNAFIICAVCVIIFGIVTAAVM